MSRTSAPPLFRSTVLVLTLGFCGRAALLGQDYMALRINEVIADNSTVEPRDMGLNTVNMIEIYNTSDALITLGGATVDASIGLSDTLTVPPTHPGDDALYTFRDGITILPEGYLVIFCDANASQDFCEPHANFQIASNGSEPISLWGPKKGDGTRALIDQVWLPPLSPDVSFGRFPDGFGAAPVPLDDVLTTFVFNPPTPSGFTATFGSCVSTGVPCSGGTERVCLGTPNSSGGNVEPRVDILTFSTNSPGAGEPVQFVVTVEDEKEPLAPNIASVRIIYRVDGGPEQTVEMAYDGAGIHHTRLTDYQGNDIGENPFNVWTEWEGAIPGQPAGSRVEFVLEVRDKDGGVDTMPETICADGVGPCDREFGGTINGATGCQLDPNDKVVCDEGEDNTPVIRQGIRYFECEKRATYLVGYEPPAPLAGVVLNEVVAAQTSVLRDPTEDPTKLCDDGTFICRYDDFIELYNGSAVEADLSGLWLSDSAFRPRGWKFPDGSRIAAGQHLIVWLDGDGARCPAVPPPPGGDPCFWDCPDPTNAVTGVYHASFSLNADGDDVYLFDREENGFGVLNGAQFDDLPTDSSLALIPDGDRDGCWIVSSAPTVDPTTWSGLPNVGECPDTRPEFFRGDANSDCRVDLSDGIFILNWLFTGGKKPDCLDAADSNDTQKIDISDGIFVFSYLFLGAAAPPAPGPKTRGPDPTEDSFEECVPPSC